MHENACSLCMHKFIVSVDMKCKSQLGQDIKLNCNFINYNRICNRPQLITQINVVQNTQQVAEELGLLYISIPDYLGEYNLALSFHLPSTNHMVEASAGSFLPSH